MSDAKGQQEPSMEEILASIRRIISEDGDGAEDEPAALEPTGAADEDVLELTDMVADDGSVVDLNNEAANEAPLTAAAPESAPAVAPEPTAAPPPPTAGDNGLMSAPAKDAAVSSLAALAAASKVGTTPTSSGAGVTVEDLTRELLRPILREWLDENLPGMVERIVRDEIEKMTARAGG